MGEFFSQRLSRHFKKMSKYLRYILNDHFVLVCMFLLGGLGLYYSQLLKELPRDFVWGRPLILLGWLLLFTFTDCGQLSRKWPIDAVDCSHNRLVVSNLLFIFGHASLYDLYTS